MFSRKGPGFTALLRRVTRPPARLSAIAFPPVVPHGEKNAGGVFGAASLSSGGQIKRDVCRRVYAGCAVSSAVYAFAQSADGEQILSAAFPTENAPSRPRGQKRLAK